MSTLSNNINNDGSINDTSNGVLLSKSSNFNDSRADSPLTSDAMTANRPTGASAVSWGAVLAGTVAAAATLLLLAILGVGLGMSSASVFTGQGLDAETIGITGIIWLVLIQIVAYAIGGYLAARLRTKTISIHTNEVHFRDTAHGFLTWALSTLLCITLLASAIGSIVGGAARMGGSVISGAATAGMMGAAGAVDVNAIGDEIKDMTSGANPMKYMMSSLFRKDFAKESTATESTATATSTEIDTSATTRNNNTRQTGAMDETAEVASIFMNNMNSNALPADDAKYLAQLVVEQTGINQAQAEARVNSTFSQLQTKKTQAIATAKETAETARKTGAYSAISFFGFLLIGLISACIAANVGGKARDL